MSLLRVRPVAVKCVGSAINSTRNYASNRFVPSIFFDDPFHSHRKMIADFWNTPDVFDMQFGLAPSSRFIKYRPLDMQREDEHTICSAKDGFQVSMNVAHFKPDEINVKVIDNCILVEAKHEERSEDGESYVSRQFNRRYLLPEEYNIADVVSKLSSDGILTVIAPPKQIDASAIRNIQIEHTGAPAVDKAKESHKDAAEAEPEKITTAA